jgi:prefoldin subunit 5
MKQPEFFELNESQQILLLTVLTYLLADDLNANQLNILGNFIESLGQNLLLVEAVISANTSTRNWDSKSTMDVQNLIQIMQQEINALKKRVSELEALIYQ